MAQQLERNIHDLEQLRDAYKESAQMFKAAGKPHRLLFTDEPEKKTNPQLAYLHKVVLPILTRTLHDEGIISLWNEEVAKEWLKEEAGYGKHYVKYTHGKPEARFVGNSFRDASKPTMIGIINLAIERCAFLGAVVPEPTEFNLKEKN